MFRRFLAAAVVLAACCSRVFAQYDVAFSHYFDMEPAYNAAAVGKESRLNIDAVYAIGMAGYENNPQTMYAAVDVPFLFLKSYHGAGIQFMNDQIGLFTHQKLSIQYAYKHKLFGGTISVGVSVGVLSENFDGSDLDLEDSSDPAFSSSELDGNAFDLGAGLYYMRGPWYVGVSAQHLTSPLVELGETNEIQIDPTYYFTAGYNIKLRSPFLTIKPSVLFQTDWVDWRADITGRLVYEHEQRMMYGGVTYSPEKSVTFLVGGKVHGVVLGYSYELYTSGISAVNGSHELFVGYQMDINLIKKGKNKHKSVRIL